MDWIDLARDLGKWRSVVNTITNLVPQQIGISSLAQQVINFSSLSGYNHTRALTHILVAEELNCPQSSIKFVNYHILAGRRMR
jgi:hypothetical protein